MDPAALVEALAGKGKREVRVPKDLVGRTLAAKPQRGKHSLEPILSFAKEEELPMQIIEDHQVENEAEIHLKKSDLWFCLQGRARFTCGGAVVAAQFKKRADGSLRDDEVVGTNIEGGRKYILDEGDWLWIPAGVPHMHGSEGVARLMIIKVPIIE